MKPSMALIGSNVYVIRTLSSLVLCVRKLSYSAVAAAIETIVTQTLATQPKKTLTRNGNTTKGMFYPLTDSSVLSKCFNYFSFFYK